MEQPLVDSEGYPRADIDVYQVRLVRHQIICKFWYASVLQLSFY